MARCVEDPSKLGDIMLVEFGDTRVINDELAEEGEGRRWSDHGPQWVNTEGKKDGFRSFCCCFTGGLLEVLCCVVLYRRFT